MPLREIDFVARAEFAGGRWRLTRELLPRSRDCGRGAERIGISLRPNRLAGAELSSVNPGESFAGKNCRVTANVPPVGGGVGRTRTERSFMVEWEDWEEGGLRESKG